MTVHPTSPTRAILSQLPVREARVTGSRCRRSRGTHLAPEIHHTSTRTRPAMWQAGSGGGLKLGDGPPFGDPGPPSTPPDQKPIASSRTSLGIRQPFRAVSRRRDARAVLEGPGGQVAARRVLDKPEPYLLHAVNPAELPCLRAQAAVRRATSRPRPGVRGTGTDESRIFGSRQEKVCPGARGLRSPGPGQGDGARVAVTWPRGRGGSG